MLAAIALSLLITEVPARATIAMPPIDNRGAKISAETLSNLRDFAGMALMEMSQVEVLTATIAAAALRSCPGTRCGSELANKLGSDEVLITRILAIGPVCAVTVSWWSFESYATRAAAVRDGACTEQALMTSLREALVSVSRPPSLTAPPKTAASGAPRCDAEEGTYAGYATLDTAPYSQIAWGEQELGETPLSKLKFPAGCVELVATAADGRSKKVRIRIEPNKLVRYRFDLGPASP